jgi:digeranylgeranylglycerophospholipid reductase
MRRPERAPRGPVAMRPRETLRWTCDVLVVGAGPAGTVAAREAARRGFSVILVERRERVGTPVHCAEFAPRVVGRFLSLSEDVICQPIHAMETLVADIPEAKTVVNGLMLHRDRFDHTLALQAVADGARLETRVRVTKVHEGMARAVRGDAEVTVKARVIVGTDGPLSTVGKSIGCTNRLLMPTAQYRMVLKKPAETTRIFFHPSIIGGYGWVFPKRSMANVGVGLHSSRTGNPRAVLDRFAALLVERGIVEPQILGVTGGYLPAGGLIRPWKQWVIMAGDAAGTCHPITGAGIWNALISGEMAGIAAAEALKQNSTAPLRTYAAELASFLGPSLAWASVRRRNMVRQWQSGDFNGLIRRSWIAFDEYRRRTGRKQ